MFETGGYLSGGMRRFHTPSWFFGNRRDQAVSTESRDKEAIFFQRFKEAMARSKALARNCLA
jgi:hypothetical protein